MKNATNRAGFLKSRIARCLPVFAFSRSHSLMVLRAEVTRFSHLFLFRGPFCVAHRVHGIHYRLPSPLLLEGEVGAQPPFQNAFLALYRTLSKTPFSRFFRVSVSSSVKFDLTPLFGSLSAAIFSENR